jgi:hypothetical protein
MSQLVLPTREDMIVKIKKHEKIPTLGEVLELRAQAREQLYTVVQLYTVGQFELKNGSIVGSSSM